MSLAVLPPQGGGTSSGASTTGMHIPAEVWALVLSYGLQLQPDPVTEEPHDDRPEGKMTSSLGWLLCRSISAALDEWLRLGLEERGMQKDGEGILQLVAPIDPDAYVPSAPSIYVQKRSLLALSRSPEESFASIHRVEDFFLSDQRSTSDSEEKMKKTLVQGGGQNSALHRCTSVVEKILQSLSSVSFIGRSFLHGVVGLKRVDLRHMTMLHEIQDDFLRFGSVEEIFLPDSLTTIGDQFLEGCMNLEEVHLSNTALTSVGSSFLANTRVKLLRLPPSLNTTGRGLLTEVKATQIDMSSSSLETLTSMFLSRSNVEKLLLPLTLTTVGIGFLAETSLTTHIDLSHSALTKIGPGFLVQSRVEVLVLPRTLKEVGAEFLGESTAPRIDLSNSFLETVGLGFLTGSRVEELLLPRTLKKIGTGFLYGSTATHIDPSNSFVESVDRRFLGKSTVETIILPACLQKIGGEFLEASLAKRIDLSKTFVEQLENS